MKSLEPSSDLVAHVAFSLATVTRELVTTPFAERDLRDAVASMEGRKYFPDFSSGRI
jgi:hypothetical protein